MPSIFLEEKEAATTTMQKRACLGINDSVTVSSTSVSSDQSSSHPISSHAEVPKAIPADAAPSASASPSLTAESPSLPRAVSPPSFSTGLPCPNVRNAGLLARARNDPLNVKYRHRPFLLPAPANGGKTYLATLPDHILDDIISGLSDHSLWALMGTCRSLREMAEVALKPRLRIGELRADPPLSTNIFESIDPVLAENDAERKRQLHRANRRLKCIVDAYPRARTLMRELTVEVRSDDAEASWGVLRELAPRLEMLKIHVVDERWQVRPEDYDGNPAPRHTEDPLEVLEAWPSWFTSGSHFYYLTSLSITATAYTFAHFAQIAPLLPKLRDLALSAHGSDRKPPLLDTYVGSDAPAMPKLRSLVVAGIYGNVVPILRGVLRDILRGGVHQPSDLARLIIHISDTPDLPSPPYDAHFWAMAWDIMTVRGLQELGIYCAMGGDLVAAMVENRTMITPSDPRYAMPNLTGLVMEFDRKKPILHRRPRFPSLKYLTFVVKPAGDRDVPILRPHKLLHGEFYDVESLLAVFDYYKKLHRVQWVLGYPTNPFGKKPDWPRESIACYVDRPTDGGPLRARRPSIAPK